MERVGINTECEKKYCHDAVVVLGGGLTRIGNKYYPTSYTDSDDYGILGGGMRIAAAVNMYVEGKSKVFVFSTGITEKNQQKFGGNIPTEAEVYERQFLRIANYFRKRQSNLNSPTTIQEANSKNTSSNLTEISNLIQQNGWEKVAIVSNNFHIPRIKALWQKIVTSMDVGCFTVFVSAEDYLQKHKPGKYDRIIDRFTNPNSNLAAAIRITNEEKGIQDILNGVYKI